MRAAAEAPQRRSTRARILRRFESIGSPSRRPSRGGARPLEQAEGGARAHRVRLAEPHREGARRADPSARTSSVTKARFA